jgi:hypothetical protein
MDGVPDLTAAGATDIYVNIASFASGVSEAPKALEQLVSELARVTA